MMEGAHVSLKDLRVLESELNKKGERGQAARRASHIIDKYGVKIVENTRGAVIVVTDSIRQAILTQQGQKCERYKKTKDPIEEHPTFEVRGINTLYQDRFIPVNLDYHGYATLTEGKQSALVHIMDNEAHLINQYDLSYGVTPKNREQYFAFDALFDPDVKLVALTGQAGTGKTFLALAAGLQQTLNEKLFNKIMISRPVVSMGNEIGFLPGTMEEKMEPWMKPIYDNLDVLHRSNHMKGKSGANELLSLGILEIEALSLIRGRSIQNQFVLIDEAQNLTPHEMKTILTRAGEGTKIVLSGDPFQIDSLKMDEYSNGLSYVVERMYDSNIFAHIHFTKCERSELAKQAASRL